jgi:hypothetical protein
LGARSKIFGESERSSPVDGKVMFKTWKWMKVLYLIPEETDER